MIMPAIALMTMILAVPFSMTSCKSPDTGKISVTETALRSTPYLRPASSAIGIGLIAIAETKEMKVQRALWLYTVSTAIRTVAADKPPTEEQFRMALQQITPKDQDDWLQAVIGLSSLYSGFKAQFGHNTGIILSAINQIAMGLKDAAMPYAKPPTDL